MAKNPFSFSDDQIKTLLSSYTNWLSRKPEHQDYIKELKEVNKYLHKTFLNPAYLNQVKNEDLKDEIKSYASGLEGPANIRLGNKRILDNLKSLKSNFLYVLNSNDDPYQVAFSLLEGNKKLQYFSKAFWSPILQSRYPKDIPNWNNKTEGFLKKLGVNLQSTKLNTKEKIEKLSVAFKYLHQLEPGLDFYHLNHLMHYGTVIKEGKELIEKLTGNPTPVPRAKINFARIYEVKNGLPAANYSRLKDDSNESLYWNEEKFTNLNVGDYVYFVCTPHSESLYTIMQKKGITSKYSPINDTTSFSNNGLSYSCKGKWDKFIHFKILQKASIPENWNWTKIIGRFEMYDIWKNGIKDIPDRINKVDDLLSIFKKESANSSLLNYRILLVKEQVQRITIKFFENQANRKLIQSRDFYFENARISLKNFLDYDISKIKDRLISLAEQYRSGNLSFIDFLNQIKNAAEKEFFELIGRFVAHVDFNAANKNQWNTNEDKRVISTTMVDQKTWVDQLTKYKIDKSFKLSVSIQNVLNYLKSPENYLPITSESHKNSISSNLLKASYEGDSKMIDELKKLCEIQNYNIASSSNLTRIMNELLYEHEIKIIWDPKLKKGEESIKGLVVCDSTGWIDKAIADLSKSNYIVLWWDKRPSGVDKTIKLLKETIKREKVFYIYFSINQVAHYRARICDFSEEKEYASKNWNHNEDVAWHEDLFSDYKGTKEDGKTNKASIAFLADKIEKLESPIPVSNFVFYKEFGPPTQNNMQPYVEILDEEPNTIPPHEKKVTKEEPKKIIEHISQYIAGQGFKFDIKDITNFYLALKTKPFVILAGISGTGKTKLVELFAEAIGYGDDDHCVIIPVKPDWTDNSDLMGYTNLNKEFEKKKLTEVILAAHNNPDHPYFVILDEMNLARVEHYFSDFLSIIETRKIESGIFTTKPLLYGNDVGEKTTGRDKLVNIQIPQNLYIVGTVNMDETTFPFSKKVLDRANSIEMNQVNLDFIDQVDPVDSIHGVYNDFLISDKINSSHIENEELEFLKDNGLIDNLKQINEILAEADLQFAYRIRDEISFYMLHSKKVQEIFPWYNALDYQIMQKILPRIQGSAISISYLLISLINHFMANKEKFDKKAHYEDIQEDLHEYIAANPKFSRTLKKLDFMLRRYNQDGFTSFWI